MKEETKSGREISRRSLFVMHVHVTTGIVGVSS